MDMIKTTSVGGCFSQHMQLSTESIDHALLVINFLITRTNFWARVVSNLFYNTCMKYPLFIEEDDKI